jgi:hypothetical protein
MLSTVNELSERLRMIDQLRNGLSSEAKRSSKPVDAYLEWLKSEVIRTLSSDQLVVETTEDGCGLVKMSIEAPNKEIFDM